MENQSNQPNQSPLLNAVVELQSPERKQNRRRFVQSTLFPLKNCVQEEVKNGGNDEIGGSQGGKKSGGRRKSVDNKRGKKVNDCKLENFDEIVGVRDDDDDDVEEICGSQGSKGKRGRNSTPRKRGFKKGAVNGKDDSIVAIDDGESPDDGTPEKSNKKQRASTRKGRTNGNKAIPTSLISNDLIATEQLSQPVPDLWLEAKKTAEENSRIFAGKQIHPFFSSWKAGKKDLETIDLESHGSLEKRKGKNVEFAPVHVFENVKDDSDSINWCNWTFDDWIFSKTCDRDTQVSSLEGTIGSSNFDDILIASNLPTSTPPILVDERDDEVRPYHPLLNSEKNPEVSEACIYGRSGVVSSCFDEENAVPHERVMSYYLSRGNYPENSLWTNKYHPEKALEVCGNSEAVNFVNDWLRLWHETDFRFSKSSYSVDTCSMNDVDYDSCESESYSENVEQSGLKNVLLVTGPVGSGKTAAIYACAKEQGFQIIEVNASDWRNGALLKQKFGEAVGSHGLKRSQGSPMSKMKFKSSPLFTTNGASKQDLNNGVNVISLLEEEDYVGEIGSQSNGGISCDKTDIKTLILFEDVDVNLCDDRGLISTIQQLADTAKRPMILTSNNESPLLPDSLDREEVCFTMPSQKELARHLQLVCSAEKTSIQPDLIERCVEFCRGDIRKTLTLLQFWCQSKECIKDGKAQSLSAPVTFNLEASYCLLPKLIPWELPSLLSEFIESEVAKSFSKMKENNTILGVIEEEDVDKTVMKNELDFKTGEQESIEAKKEAILNGNCYLHVDNDLLAGCNTELSNSSGSPVAFTRRNIRQKSGPVMSDSEDEICNHETKAVRSLSPVLHLALDGVQEVEAAGHQSLETGHVGHIDFFGPSDTFDHSNDTVVLSSEADRQRVGSELAYFSSCGKAMESSNLLDDGDRYIVDNLHQSPSMGLNFRNLFEDKPFGLREANGLEIGRGNLPNLNLNSGTDSVMVGSPRNMFDLRIETVNHCGSLATGDSFNQVFDLLNKSNMENNGRHGQERVDANPLCYKSLGHSFNPSNGQLFHFVGAKEKEILHQHADVNDSNHHHHAGVDGLLNHLGGNFLGIGNPEKRKEQNHKNGDFRYDSYLGVDDSLKLINEQPCEMKNEESIQQLPNNGIVDLKGCSALGNDLNLSNGNSPKYFETKTEEHQCQYSDTTNVNHLVRQCQSVDMSYVPESTFVPETEVNDGTECQSVPDLMEIISPVTTGNVETSILGCETSDYRVLGIDLNENARDIDEEMGDSLVENDHLEASTSGCPVMDECSRMDFCKRFNNVRSSELINPVQERWNELRQTDLRQYLSSEHGNARQLVELSCLMSSLLSDSDLLLHDREVLTNDLSDQETVLREETHAFGWHDQHVQMAFAIAQYGYFLYAKDIHALQPKMDLAKPNNLHLGWEMLVSTSNLTVLGKLLSLNRSPISLTDSSIKQATVALDTAFTREREMCLQNIVESVVPLKSYLTVRGNVLHDYLSSLAHISKYESSRLAESSERTKRRRVRVAKNYLSSGALDLSQDDILKLNEYNSYGKSSSKLIH